MVAIMGHNKVRSLTRPRNQELCTTSTPLYTTILSFLYDLSEMLCTYILRIFFFVGGTRSCYVAQTGPKLMNSFPLPHEWRLQAGTTISTVHTLYTQESKPSLETLSTPCSSLFKLYFTYAFYKFTVFFSVFMCVICIVYVHICMCEGTYVWGALGAWGWYQESSLILLPP